MELKATVALCLTVGVLCSCLHNVVTTTTYPTTTDTQDPTESAIVSVLLFAVKDLKHEVKRLHDAFQFLAATVETQDDYFDERLRALERKSTQHMEEYMLTRDGIEQLKQDQLDQHMQLHNQKGMINRQIGAVRRDIDKLNGPKDMVVFSAFLDHNIHKPPDYATVVFNQILINEGSAYNPSTGIFTCPKNGLYDFSYVIGQRHDNEVWAELRVNNEVYVAAAADAEHKWQDLQGGNRAFVRLTTGDTVRVTMTYNNENIEGKINRFTTFSGILVSE